MADTFTEEQINAANLQFQELMVAVGIEVPRNYSFNPLYMDMVATRLSQLDSEIMSNVPAGPGEIVDGQYTEAYFQRVDSILLGQMAFNSGVDPANIDQETVERMAGLLQGMEQMMAPLMQKYESENPEVNGPAVPTGSTRAPVQEPAPAAAAQDPVRIPVTSDEALAGRTAFDELLQLRIGLGLPPVDGNAQYSVAFKRETLEALANFRENVTDRDHDGEMSPPELRGESMRIAQTLEMKTKEGQVYAEVEAMIGRTRSNVQALDSLLEKTGGQAFGYNALTAVIDAPAARPEGLGVVNPNYSPEDVRRATAELIDVAKIIGNELVEDAAVKPGDASFFASVAKSRIGDNPTNEALGEMAQKIGLEANDEGIARVQTLISNIDDNARVLRDWMVTHTGTEFTVADLKSVTETPAPNVTVNPDVQIARDALIQSIRATGLLEGDDPFDLNQRYTSDLALSLGAAGYPELTELADDSRASLVESAARIGLTDSDEDLERTRQIINSSGENANIVNDWAKQQTGFFSFADLGGRGPAVAAAAPVVTVNPDVQTARDALILSMRATGVLEGGDFDLNDQYSNDIALAMAAAPYPPLGEIEADSRQRLAESAARIGLTDSDEDLETTRQIINSSGANARIVNDWAKQQTGAFSFADLGGRGPAAPDTSDPAAGTPTEGPAVVMETRIMPVDESVQADPRIQRLEEGLALLVPKLNGLGKLRDIDLSPETQIPVPGTADGYFDADSFAAYQASMQHLNFLAENMIAINLNDPAELKRGQASEYVAGNKGGINLVLNVGLGGAISDKEAELAAAGDDEQAKVRIQAEIDELNILKDQTVPQLLADIDELHKEGKLGAATEMSPREVPVQDPTAPVEPTPPPSGGGKPAAYDPSADIALVEGALYLLGQELQNFDKMGLMQVVEGVVEPLTEADLKDGVFGQSSQSMLAKALVMVKEMGGQENADGSYSPGVGQQLKRAILTNPQLAPLREKLGVEAMDPATAQDYFRVLSAGAPPEQVAAQEEVRRRIEETLKMQQLNELIAAMDRLHEAKILDPQKRAAETSKMSLIMDGVAGALNKFAPGFGAWLKDFFTNSKFGQMAAGVLSMFGINVGRLWGDKDDGAALERAAPAVGKAFDDFYNEAKEEVSQRDGFDQLDEQAQFNTVMQQVKSEMLGKVDNAGWAFNKAMNLMFDGQGKEVIHSALSEALAAAEGAANPEAARLAFTNSLIAKGQAYQAGRDIDMNEVNSLLQRATDEVQDIAARDPQFAPQAPDAGAAGVAAGGTGPDTPVPPQDSTTVEGIVGAKGDLDPRIAVLASMAARAGLSADETGAARIDELMAGLSTNIEIMQSAGGRDFDAMGPTEDVHLLAKALDVDIADVSMAALEDTMRGAYTAELERNNVLIGNGFFNVPDGTDHDALRDTYLAYQQANGHTKGGDIPLIFTREGSDSVFALVRLKNDGEEDRTVTDDTYVVLEQPEYLAEGGRRITSQMFADKLMDNYKWEDETRDGIAATIDKVLGLEPIDRTPQSEAGPQAVAPRKQPESFKGLEVITEAQAAFLTGPDGLDLAKIRPDLLEKAARDGAHPLELLLQEGAVVTKGPSRFVTLELEAFGLRHGEFDAVIAMHDGNGMDIRFIDYDVDNIKPLSQQRYEGTKDMGDLTPAPQGAYTNGRRLDDTILRVIDRDLDGNVTRQGITGGYMGSVGIIPFEESGTKVVGGLQAVYGLDAANDKSNQTSYSAAVNKRWDEISAEEVEAIDAATKARMQSRRQREFEELAEPDTTTASAIDANARDMGADRDLDDLGGSMLPGPGYDRRFGAGAVA